MMAVPETEGKICVEFNKTGETGSVAFYEKFDIIKEYLGEFINASY